MIAQPEPVEVIVKAEVVEVAVVAAPVASALTSNGRAPNDPREVRRRKREAAAAAAAAQAQAQAQATEAVAEHTTPTIDENLRSVEDLVEQNPKALEEEHEPKPLA